MNVSFKTLTPVFTGNVSQKSPFLRDAGIMGSLRFWAGAIARGVGFKIKGDGPDHKIDSIDDVKKLDPITRVFGCTGWRRVFQQNIRAPEHLLHQSSKVHVLGQNSGWYITPGCLYPWDDQPVTVTYNFRKPLKPQWEAEARGWLQLTWYFIHCLAGLGAHQGWGYGQIRLEDSQLSAVELDDVTQQHNSGMPDLADFIFAEYEFKALPRFRPLGEKKFFFETEPSWENSKTPARMLPVGLPLRYRLRYGYNRRFRYNFTPTYRTPFGKWGRRFFGDSRDNFPAGHFHGSLIYRTDANGVPSINGDRYRFRIWAWLPKNLFNGRGGMPTWINAAKLLKREMQSNALWNDIAGCAPPRECYFWPLTPGSTITGSHCIRGIVPFLNEIEARARTLLKRNLPTGGTL